MRRNLRTRLLAGAACTAERNLGRGVQQSSSFWYFLSSGITGLAIFWLTSAGLGFHFSSTVILVAIKSLTNAGVGIQSCEAKEGRRAQKTCQLPQELSLPDLICFHALRAEVSIQRREHWGHAASRTGDASALLKGDKQAGCIVYRSLPTKRGRKKRNIRWQYQVWKQGK